MNFAAAHHAHEMRELDAYLDGGQEIHLPPVYEDEQGRYRDTHSRRFLSSEAYWARLEAWKKRVGWLDARNAEAALQDLLEDETRARNLAS